MLALERAVGSIALQAAQQCMPRLRHYRCDYILACYCCILTYLFILHAHMRLLLTCLHAKHSWCMLTYSDGSRQADPEDEAVIKSLLDMVMLINPGMSAIVPYAATSSRSGTAPPNVNPLIRQASLSSIRSLPAPSPAPVLALTSPPPFFASRPVSDPDTSPDGLPRMATLSGCFATGPSSAGSWEAVNLAKDLLHEFEAAQSPLKNLVVFSKGKGKGQSSRQAVAKTKANGQTKAVVKVAAKAKATATAGAGQYTGKGKGRGKGKVRAKGKGKGKVGKNKRKGNTIPEASTDAAVCNPEVAPDGNNQAETSFSMEDLVQLAVSQGPATAAAKRAKAPDVEAEILAESVSIFCIQCTLFCCQPSPHT